jgi:tight adherence protein B
MMRAEAVAFGMVVGGAVTTLGIASRVAERGAMQERLGAVAAAARPRRVVTAQGWWRARSLLVVAAVAIGGYRLAGPVGAAALVIVAALMDRARRARSDRARRELEEEQLGDVVAGLAAASRAGLSLRRSLYDVAVETEEPLRRRLRVVLTRLDLGEPIEASLAPVASVSPDGRMLAAVLVIHARVGGDLPALLDEVARVVRNRIDGRRHARALTAQGRASGAVLAVLPIAFVGLLSGTSGNALGAFYRTWAGSLLLLVGLALEGAGFMWLRRIMRGVTG